MDGIDVNDDGNCGSGGGGGNITGPRLLSNVPLWPPPITVEVADDDNDNDVDDDDDLKAADNAASLSALLKSLARTNSILMI